MSNTENSSDRPGIETRLVVRLLGLGTYLVRTGARLVAEHGISQQQSVILIAVTEQGPVSQRDIRSALLFERSNVSKAVAHLAAMGLLVSRKSAADGRVVLLEATEKGREVAAACMASYSAWNEAWLKGVPLRDLRRTLHLLERLKSADAD